MKKIPAIKAEVIRFYTEDVIVTSGTGQSSQSNPVFSPPNTYFTLGRELIDAGEKATSTAFYKYIPNNPSNSFEYDKSTATRYFNTLQIGDNWLYTWYSDNSWHSTGQTKNYFLDNNIDWTN